jgi:putative ABC transport system permease protein
MGAFVQDLRYGVRTLLKRPAFAVVAVLTLALGIGANTAVFSVVNSVLLRPLPLKDPDRIVVPVSANAERGYDAVSVPYADYVDWKNDGQLFESLALYTNSPFELTGEGEPERVAGVEASGEYFAVLGVPPVAGRALLPGDDAVGGAEVAVIGEGLWRRRYGADPGVVGRAIRLNGNAHTVVGVMPALPDHADVWVPLVIDPAEWGEDLTRRDNFIWEAIARLKEGVTREQADARLAAIASRIEQDYYAERKGWTSRTVPVLEYFVGSQVRNALLVLLGAVGLVLLIACVNIANLWLTRMAAREREMAIRAALGAGRARLLRQLLAESLILGVAGGTAGLLLALWGVAALTAFAPADVPRLQEVGVDGNVLVFALAITLLTSLLFGLLPALQAAGTSLNEVLKEGGRSLTGGQRGRRVRNALVVAEVALSLVLLVGAGLMVRSFVQLQRVDPGFDTEGLLTMQVTLPARRYAERPQVADALEGIADALESLPGVKVASAGSALPLGGGGFYLGRVFLAEGMPEPPAGPDFTANWNVVTPDFFATLRMPVLAGRTFTERDDADSPPVIVVNETLARRMFPNGDAIGKRIRSWRDENTLREIVGIVQDVRYAGRDDQPRGLVYVPHRQDAWRSMVLAVKTDGDPTRLVAAVRNAVWSVDKDLAMANVTTMRQILSASTAGPRFTMALLTAFAALAMLLAAIGIYGVVSYSVAQRTHEIGVRMALGARAGDVMRMVVSQGVKLTAVGVVAGLAGAFALTRLMESLLFEVSATDPAVFGAVALALVAVALVASLIPARRAARVDPMVALRYE